jgi:glycosyltransferase involved in cell wall biosynthesis
MTHPETDRFRQPSVAVVIPLHNGGEAFLRCIACLAANQPQPHQVIVVSDGCTDDAWRHAQTAGAEVVHHETTRGPAAARNTGARKAETDLILFLDADVAVPPDLIARVQAFFKAHPRVDALFGSYDHSPDKAGFWSQYRNLFHHWVHQNAMSEARSFWAGCGAVRKEAFQRVKGFDSQRYPQPSIEDIDLGLRLKEQGFTIRLDKTLQVQHLKRWRFVPMVRTDIFRRAVPWSRLILEKKSIPNDLNLKTGDRVSALIVLAVPVLFLFPHSLLFITIAAGSLLLLNARLYRFFLRHRGGGFMLRAIFAHWLYLFYAGLTFAICALLYHLSAGRIRAGDRQKGSA